MGEMKMGRRRPGRSLSSLFERGLRRHIEACKHKHSTAGEIVDYLRANFSEYGRLKLQPFTRTVQKTLDLMLPQNHSKKTDNSSNQDRPSTSNDDDDEDEGPARKKKKKIEANEERLQRLEVQHMRKKQRVQVEDSSSSSSSTSSSSSDEADGAVSTSEDAVYGEKFEPEVDLMKSMLRASYSGWKSAAKSKPPPGEKEEENVELELFNSKYAKKVDMLEEDTNLGKGDAENLTDAGGGEVKGNDGPRFRDLGGMAGVVEELKMEVIVPLYHPQLPRWLGVRPMAGILLHGPPGCGKTKLAHAIANETGVPFYKISATELVSGVSGIN